MPVDYGHWKSVYNRYNNGSKKGYITAILEEFKKIERTNRLYLKVHQDVMRSSHYNASQASGSSVGALALKFMPKYRH
ncbi:hypothetical protein [Legionella sainthelensi]|uniref:Uncharacterized protein n=1 Tax=Legionella sainthelensi TaxID=28087 RepID=A0A2H5FID9_9GAMM|nr:hypothetical protein [Legionella sainthelensi]AUH71319.1 hypothetical protein CAB17_03995 [Legionella sainthelensi]